nr:hypothetical protein GCM10020093_031900 [Planobispora longispora]
MSEINGDNRLADDETTVSLVRTRIEDLRKAITALSGLDPASSPGRCSTSSRQISQAETGAVSVDRS